MSLTELEVVERIESLTVTRLRRWVASGWVSPAHVEDAPRYTDADLARLRMICDLYDVCEFDEEVVPVLLSLIDRIHGLRRELSTLARAVEAQPADVRERIKSAYFDLMGD